MLLTSEDHCLYSLLWQTVSYPKKAFINPAIKQTDFVMPGLIRHPVPAWIPAFAGMTTLMYLIVGVIISIGYYDYPRRKPIP